MSVALSFLGHGAASARLTACVQADPGYAGEVHEHDFSEFSDVLDGEYRAQGQTMREGDAYVAAPRSVQTDFTTETEDTDLPIFTL